jgi:hypothetical protein
MKMASGHGFYKNKSEPKNNSVCSSSFVAKIIGIKIT